jgi:hypothetical protein
MEWQAFSAPFPAERTPAAVQRIQRFMPDNLPGSNVSEEYESLGIVGLMRVQREAAYQEVVWALARTIADFFHTYSVEPRVFRRTDLRNAFSE